MSGLERLDDEGLWDLVDRDSPELEEYARQYPEDGEKIADLRRLVGAVAQDAAPCALRRGDRVGGYEIVRWLGEGGMGVVYEARQRNPERLVALKVLRPGTDEQLASELFDRESRALARLSHPNIATIHESGSTDAGGHYLVMELVRGSEITRYASDAALTTRARIELFAIVCEAVQDAHEHGVLHRDLKPSNVLVDARGSPKILDFGLARVVEAGRSLATTTGGKGIMGTLPYMSPEELRGDRRSVGARSDVYSLGVMLYELLTGELPFDFENTALATALRSVTESRPPAPSRHRKELRGELDTILMKALISDPRERYESAADLADDLRRHIAHRPIRARRRGVMIRARKLARRHWMGLGAFALIVFMFVFSMYATTFRVALFNSIGSDWFMEAAPWSELRWRGDTPIVKVEEEWYELVSIDGLNVAYVVGFCQQATDPWMWRKRFSEDLMQVIHRLGALVFFEVDLVLIDEEGRRVELPDVRLEKENRRRILRDRRAMTVSLNRASRGIASAHYDGRDWELVEIGGSSGVELAATADRLTDGRGWGGMLYDLYVETGGESAPDRIAIVLRDPATGELLEVEESERTASPPPWFIRQMPILMERASAE